MVYAGSVGQAIGVVLRWPVARIERVGRAVKTKDPKPIVQDCSKAGIEIIVWTGLETAQIFPPDLSGCSLYLDWTRAVLIEPPKQENEYQS